MIYKLYSQILNFFRVNFFYRFIFKKIGKSVKIGKNVQIYGGKNIILCDNVEIKDGCVFYCNNAEEVILHENVSLEVYNIINTQAQLKIGKNTMTAPFVSMNTGNHIFNKEKTDIRFSSSKHVDMCIGEDCWLGIGARLLSGTNLGNHCVVGANSVVNKTFEDNLVIAGIPAKVIKKRLDNEMGE